MLCGQSLTRQLACVFGLQAITSLISTRKLDNVSFCGRPFGFWDNYTFIYEVPYNDLVREEEKGNRKEKSYIRGQKKKAFIILLVFYKNILFFVFI